MTLDGIAVLEARPGPVGVDLGAAQIVDLPRARSDRVELVAVHPGHEQQALARLRSLGDHDWRVQVLNLRRMPTHQPSSVLPLRSVGFHGNTAAIEFDLND